MKQSENRLFHFGIIKLAALTNSRSEQCAWKLGEEPGKAARQAAAI